MKDLENNLLKLKLVRFDSNPMSYQFSFMEFMSRRGYLEALVLDICWTRS